VKYSELTIEARSAIEQLRLKMSDMLIDRGLLYPE